MCARAVGDQCNLALEQIDTAISVSHCGSMAWTP
jgi:hypothetical protein